MHLVRHMKSSASDICYSTYTNLNYVVKFGLGLIVT